MLRAEDLGIELRPDDPFSIDHESGSAGKQIHQFRYTKQLPQSILLVRNHEIGQPFSGGEFAMCFVGIRTDRDDGRAEFRKVLIGVSERAGFQRADGCVIAGIEEENDGLFSLKVRQRHGLTIGGDDRKIGRSVANFN